MARSLGAVLLVASWALVAYGAVSGLWYALTIFFRVQRCIGSECVWLFQGWHPLAWGLLYLVYLPFSELVAVWASWPAFLAAAVLGYLGGRMWAADTGLPWHAAISRAPRALARSLGQPRRVQVRLWIWWVAATFIGASLGLAIGVVPALMLAVVLNPGGDPLQTTGGAEGVVFIAIGTGAATAQWLVVRQYLRQSSSWVAATVVGLLLCFGGGHLLGLDPVQSVGLVPFGTGIAQWLMLRRRVPAAAWWLLASIGGGILGAIVARAVGAQVWAGTGGAVVVSSSVGAALSGLALVVLLTHAKSASEKADGQVPHLQVLT